MDSFDRVEHLARQMCEDAGGQWDRKGTRQVHWRERAASALAEAEPRASWAVFEWPDHTQRALACLILGVALGAFLTLWVLS